MVDQVSLTAIGGLSASRNKKLMNFLACGPGQPVVYTDTDTDLKQNVRASMQLLGTAD